jgi:benzoyl-CoA reductase/2-hydroxyglutaryl-CoA dehydratase subunit BcrC/BadD/HgdB
LTDDQKVKIEEVMRDCYLDLDRAAKDPKRRVVWHTSVEPAEIPRAMDLEVFFPENHGALLGATRTAQDVVPVANAFGCSPDICSYLNADIETYLEGLTPLTKAYGIDSAPGPDVLVYSTNQRREVTHWFGFYASELGVPIFGFHPPRLTESNG